MKIRARAEFKPVSFEGFERKIQPAIIAAVKQGTNVVVGEAMVLVHVDSGDLMDTIRGEVAAWTGFVVKGWIIAGNETVNYAAFNEFGTGIRGASSAGAGPYAYNMEWPGMVAIPFMRPALDNSRDRILAAFTAHGFKT